MLNDNDTNYAGISDRKIIDFSGASIQKKLLAIITSFSKLVKRDLASLRGLLERYKYSGQGQTENFWERINTYKFRRC
jgi:hypothetical protein